jgi:hypothetical protein
MTRWIGKRGLWGVVTGTAVAAGSVLVAAEPGETVVFKEGNKDRKVTIVKVNKRADKSVEVHGKDAVTGEAVVWVEGESSIPPSPPAGTKAPAPAAKAPAAPVAAGKDAGLPKAKARPDDPIGSTVVPMPETPAERERRLFNGKIFGRESTPPAAAAAPGAAMPQIAEAGEPKSKPGLLSRIFGKKTPAPVPTVMPGPAITTPTTPAAKGAPTASGEPKVAAPFRPTTPTPTPTPAAVPTPVAVPTPAIPVPTPLPATRPSAPVVAPVPTPLPPVVPLPGIPAIPGGAQSVRPGDTIHVVLPVGYVPVEVAMADDLRPYAATMKGGAPTERLIAAKGLADGRHGSTDQVKTMLFAAAREDDSAVVRAACIDHLVRLGYYHPDFARHLQGLADGAAGVERDAARAGLARMTPRKW